MPLVRPVAGFEHRRAEETDLDHFASNAVDLHPVADANAVLAHQNEPSKESQDESLQCNRESGSRQAQDCGHLRWHAKDDEQDEQKAQELHAEFRKRAQCAHAPPVKRGTIHEAAHKLVAQNDANEDNGDQSKRLQDKMQQDPVLQKHLVRPLAVNGGELLLRLNPVVINAEKLALLALRSQAGKSRLGIRCCAGRSRGYIGLRFQGIVLSGKAGGVRLRLPPCLLNQLVSASLREPGSDASRQCAVSLSRENRDLPLIAELRLVFVGGRLVRSEFLLDFGALIAGRTS